MTVGKPVSLHCRRDAKKFVSCLTCANSFRDGIQYSNILNVHAVSQPPSRYQEDRKREAWWGLTDPLRAMVRSRLQDPGFDFGCCAIEFRDSPTILQSGRDNGISMIDAG